MEIRHDQCVHLAGKIDQKLRAVVDAKGPDATFTVGARQLQAIVNSVLNSRGLPATEIADGESAELLRELQRLDDEFPTPSQAAQRELYVKAAAPPLPTPVPPAVPQRFLAQWKQGPGDRKIFRHPVYAIIDYKGVLVDSAEKFYPGIEAMFNRLFLANVVLVPLSFIGVQDVYDYFHSDVHEGNRTHRYMKSMDRWIASNVREGKFFTSATTEGTGWIEKPVVTNQRVGAPHHSPLMKRLGSVNPQTSGGKDYYAYKYQKAAAIFEDHAGVGAACIEIGMRSYLLGQSGVSFPDKPGLCCYRRTTTALEQLLKDCTEPARRYDLEFRQESLLCPASDIKERAEAEDVASSPYDGFNWFPILPDEFEAHFKKHGRNAVRRPPYVRPIAQPVQLGGPATLQASSKTGPPKRPPPTRDSAGSSASPRSRA